MKQALSSLIIVVVLGFTLAGHLQAQTDTNSPSAGAPKPTPDELVTHRLQDLTQKLTLTDAQQAQLKPILQEEVQKFVALRDDATVADADKRTQAKAIHDAYKPKIEALLTPDQKTLFESLKEGHHWSGNGAPGGSPAPGN